MVTVPQSTSNWHKSSERQETVWNKEFGWGRKNDYSSVGMGAEEHAQHSTLPSEWERGTGSRTAQSHHWQPEE